MAPGDRVTVYGQPAVIVRFGPCGWERCQHGDDCVTVAEDRWNGITTNVARNQVKKTT